MNLDWQYHFRASDNQGNQYYVASQGNTWTWTAVVSGPKGDTFLGNFGSGEDAKRACEQAADQQGV